MMIERFLQDRIALHAGNCRVVLMQMAENSFDACVTDPPYHLVSIVKRFGNTSPEREPFAQNNPTVAYGRLSRGFMGQTWDGGDVAFDPATWRAVYRVLKPGAHLLAMGGTRTFDMLGAAIRAAGFEIRDTIMWVYSQGFPKSHSLNRNPMCECNDGEPSTEYDMHAVRQADLSAADCDDEEQPDILFSRLSEQGLSEHGAARTKSEFSGAKQSSVDGRIIHRTREGLSDDTETGSSESASERLCVGTHSSSGEDARPTVGNGRGSAPHQSQQGGQSPGESTDLFQSSRPLDDRALRGCGACPRCGKLKKEFDGFGTALKPSAELIVLARKPLSEGTVAANVLRWGTGGLNIDGCRIATADEIKPTYGGRKGEAHGSKYGHSDDYWSNVSPFGRWPANLIHDGSAEVRAAFPDVHGAGAACENKWPRAENVNVYGKANDGMTGARFGDEGSAARFFYSSKADADDRLGSKHPTVKPLDLMQYLVRLVTPPRGLVLDPFAGTGTTGEAAWREGMSAVLIEAEPDYCNDIRRRMALALSGPDERAREAIKAKNLPRDDGPLFANISPPAVVSRETWLEMWARPFDFGQEPKP